jgi:hypothetical protein
MGYDSHANRQVWLGRLQDVLIDSEAIFSEGIFDALLLQ